MHDNLGGRAATLATQSLCKYCLWQTACFIRFSNDTNAHGLATQCPDAGIITGRFASLGSQSKPCTDYSRAAVNATLYGKCSISGDANNEATARVLVLGLLPLILLMASRMLDAVGVRNYLEKMYWSLGFTLLGLASNCAIRDYYHAFGGAPHQMEGLVRWPCSEFGWVGPFTAVFGLLKWMNWGLVAAVCVCWTYTTFARASNRYTPVRILELRDGWLAVNPLLVVLYLITIAVRLFVDLGRACIYGICHTAYYCAGMRRREEGGLDRVPKVVEVMGFQDVNGINEHVKKAFDDSVEELLKAALELLGSNILIVLLIICIDHYACPGKNTARNTLLGGVIANALNSCWRTYVVIVRQLDAHAVFARRRRLFVLDGDNASGKRGVRTGYKVAYAQDGAGNEVVSKNLICGKLFSCLLGSKEVLKDEVMTTTKPADLKQVPEQVLRVSSVRLAGAMRNSKAEIHRSSPGNGPVHFVLVHDHGAALCNNEWVHHYL